MHPVYLLSFGTLFVVLAIGGWSYLSTRRTQKHGAKAKGIGSPKDPMS